MVTTSSACPFLVPVMADALWMRPLPAFCRRPGARVKAPARETLTRVCTTGAHAQCPGFQAGRPREAGAGT
jgi:hypothetical protein